MRKVTIIGAGPGNPDLLSRAALDSIDIADVVIGAHRALAGIDVPPDVVRCELVKTADIVAELTDAASWQRAVVVMTGDVGLFSGARRLVEALSGDAQVDVRVIPGISSASYLAARLARPWQDWRFASASGAIPATACTLPHPNASAFSRMSRTPAALRSTAHTDPARATSAASIDTLPVPAPTSHTVSVAVRRSFASATARTSCLVMGTSPRMKSSSGMPEEAYGQRELAAPPAGSISITFKSSNV